MKIELPVSQKNKIYDSFATFFRYTPRKLIEGQTGELEPTGDPQTKEEFFIANIKGFIESVVYSNDVKTAQDVAIKNISHFQIHDS